MFVKVRRVAVSGVLAAMTLAALALPLPADAAIHAGEPASTTDDQDGEQVDGPSVVAALDSVQPAALRPSSKEFTLTGTVYNNGTETLENVQVLPRWDLNPLESRDDIRRVAADPELHSGSRHEDPVAFLDELDPGQSTTFELAFDDVRSIGFYAAGVYVMGVDINATSSDGNRMLQLDNDRTFVTWLPDDTKLPQVPVSMLWPVTAQPSLRFDGTHYDDSMAERLGEDGGLSSIVAAAASADDAPLTWLVDPDVTTTAGDMADGYELTDGEADQIGATAAESWLDAFTAATSNADLNWLPTAQPDLNAFARSNPRLTDRLAATSIESDRPGSTIAWPAGPSMRPNTMSALAKADTDTTVLPESALKSTGSTHNTIGTKAGDLDVTTTDSGLAAAIRDLTSSGSNGSSETTAVDFAQRWRAETALVALEALESGEDPQPLVAAPPQNWSPTRATADAVLQAWTSTPWVTTSTLAGLSKPGDWPTAELAAYQAGAALPADNVAEVSELRDESATYLSLLAEKADVEERLDDTLLRASSASWRGSPQSGLDYATSAVAELRHELANVRVIVRDDVTLASSAGQFPLTVENGLDEAVELSLEVMSSNSDRLTITNVPREFTVQPGERQTVAVKAEAKTNGKVPVQVQLTSADGTPIGSAQPSTVNATDYGTIGWVIVGAAAVLLSVGIARRVLKGKTRPRDGDTLEMQDEGDGLDDGEHGAPTTTQPHVHDDTPREPPTKVTR